MKIQNARQWFDPIQIGPKLELSQPIANVVNHYLKSAKKQQPLEINIRCPHEISEPMQDTMRETFHLYYDDVARQSDNYLERRYSRVMALVIISIVAVKARTAIRKIGEEASFLAYCRAGVAPLSAPIGGVGTGALSFR